MFGTLTDLEGSLFGQFRRLEEHMDDLFRAWPSPSIRSVVKGTFPPINVGVTPDKVHVYMFVPGLDARSVEVAIQQNLLTVSGVRSLNPTSEDATVYRRERFDGEFRRVIALPDDVIADRADAAYRDGILHVTVDRKESARPRQIAVKAA